MKVTLKTICGILALLLTLNCGTVPAYALEDGAAETTAAEETVPQETTESTVAAEAAGQTEPAETVPEAAEVETIQIVTAEDLPDTPASSIQIPLFYQTDYPNNLYSNGTIATDGCGITSLAMVATYMTGHPYLPDELAGYFGGYLENVTNNIERLEYASTALQLPWERAENFHAAVAAMREGKIVIALMNQTSIFTDAQHFIVWAGMTEEGKILVNDSYEPNYDRWELKKAFQYGFEEGDLSCGFSGGWIYDPEAMPEEPFIYTEDKTFVEPRYDLELTWSEKTLLAKMIWVEARGESAEGQQAIAEIVLNRLAADNFPNTLKGVIYAPGQFKSVDYLDEAEPTQTQYEAVENALSGPYVLPIDVVFFATYPVNKNVWGQIGGHTFCYQW